MGSLAIYWSGRLTLSTPSRAGLGLRKLGATMFIRCKRRYFALITHFSAWKLDKKGVVVEDEVGCS